MHAGDVVKRHGAGEHVGLQCVVPQKTH